MQKVNRIKKLSLVILVTLVAFSLLIGTVVAVKSGKGILTAYTDSTFTTLCPIDGAAKGSWVVFSGQTIGIEIVGITEYSSLNVGDTLKIRIQWDDGTTSNTATLTGTVYAKSGSVITVRAVWIVGEFDQGTKYVPWCSTMPVFYGGTDGNDYKSDSNIGSNQGHLHAVPEYALGGLVAIGACFAGFVAFKKLPVKRMPF